MSIAKILIADGDPRTREVFRRALLEAGHDPTVVGHAPDVIARIRESAFDLLLLDAELSSSADVGLLRQIKRARPSLLVALTGGPTSAEPVIEAFRAGAWDYLLKPVPREALRALADRARDLRDKGEERRRMSVELERERSRLMELERRLEAGDPFSKIVGGSPVMCGLVETLREIARTDSTVLLIGESGTGKGLAARAIHDASDRRRRPYVEANCVVYSEGVLHSELFGHEKGAFTGADRTKRGRFELASGGTLLLDEIGEISAATQLLLLRVLQERVFERVGGEATIEADVRLIAATNRNLEEAMRRGAFRSDLYYRLNVIPVHMPPLRERAEDVPVLAQFFLRKCVERMRREIEGFSDDALQSIARYPWPGNVRELENVVERLVVLSRTDRIEWGDLPPNLRRPVPGADVPGTLRDLERRRIEEALRETQGNKKRAAARLGIHRSTLYAKLRRYDLLDEPEWSSRPQASAEEIAETSVGL